MKMQSFFILKKQIKSETIKVTETKKNKKSLRVDLNFFAVLFIKYYWDMLYKFRLKQSATRNQYGDDDINIHKNFKDESGDCLL